MLAWGRRATIINKASELIDFMNGEPYKFILEHSDRIEKISAFKHRTLMRTIRLLLFSTKFSGK